ncbi:hypothetical protein [Mycolicibacterium fortuitum]|uniref:hypothetical protein n=1 Tax=Mycolicibacterium fortuitum TaxID=1766 RepID=UPI0013F62B1E|nr:hypothetical protein [Mycolicibacterium fortuitum]
MRRAAGVRLQRGDQAFEFVVPEVYFRDIVAFSCAVALCDGIADPRFEFGGERMKLGHA